MFLQLGLCPFPQTLWRGDYYKSELYYTLEHTPLASHTCYKSLDHISLYCMKLLRKMLLNQCMFANELNDRNGHEGSRASAQGKLNPSISTFIKDLLNIFWEPDTVYYSSYF